MHSDEYWMAYALKLAKKGQRTTTPNPNVGCVIVKDGQLVGEGFHAKAGTAHAEVHALQQAGPLAKGATAYVTLEPCSHFGRTPPCADALVAAGVSRVVCAMTDPNPQVAGRGLARLREAGIDTQSNVLLDQAERLNRGFLKRMRTGRPWVQVKMAASLDGGTAMASGESQWITGADARADVQHFRARACAIVTGIGTVLADNPTLNVRLPDTQRQPVRIVLDTVLKTPTECKLLQSPGRVVLVHTERAPKERQHALTARGAELLCLAEYKGGICLNSLLEWAGSQFNTVWVEAGATLAGSFLAQRTVDEVVLYQAPTFLGANTRPIISTHFTDLTQQIPFTLSDLRLIGNDVRYILHPLVDRG